MHEGDGLEQLHPGVYRVQPTKVTPTKYVSFFVRRRGGNLLFPCVAASSTIEGSFAAMERLGGIAMQCIGDMHFAGRHNDDIHAHFGVPVSYSEVEAADVRRKVRHVQVFPFERHALAAGIEVIPTPGHRPGAVCYAVTVGRLRCLFAGDSIWHDARGWRCPVARRGERQMRESLALLGSVPFDVLCVNTHASDPVCSLAVDAGGRRGCSRHWGAASARSWSCSGDSAPCRVPSDAAANGVRLRSQSPGCLLRAAPQASRPAGARRVLPVTGLPGTPASCRVRSDAPAK
jgi:hypothetical protein